MKKRLRYIIYAGIVSLTLTVFQGCSGSSGGDGSDTGETPLAVVNGGSWDEMTWDQDTWG